jgi:nitroreductase/FMN reductase [NAD(P)H]
MASEAVARSIKARLFERFGEDFAIDPELAGLDGLEKIAGHRSHRRYSSRPVEPDLLRLLCACALSAPSKSDLQQCDIVVVGDRTIRKAIVATIPDMPWIMDAPAFLVFAANGARLPFVCELHGKPFPNDHLDQFFNAAVDAGIVLATFLRAAAAVGLGCCPISAIRDHAQTVSDLLNMPPRVIPVAGLCVGWPAEAGEVTPRLSLSTTIVENAYRARDLAAELDASDRRRAASRPYRRQRNVERWGEAPFYGWSEDKARQYAEPTRMDFGSFVRRKGFCVD